MPCAAAVLATWSEAARADEPAWLKWQAPPECPTGEHIAKTLEGWLARPFGADEAQVTATVSGSATGWDVNVIVVQRDLRGERTMTTRTCIEAADFVALSVALAVDPSLEASLPTPAPSNEQKPTDASPTPAADAHPNEEGANQSPATPWNTEKAAVPVASSSEKAPTEQAAATNARWHVQAGTGFDAFTFPSLRFGGTAELGIDIERVSISGGATWLPPVTESVPSAQSDVAFSRLTGQLRVSYLSTLGSVELSPYFKGQAGQVFAEAVDASYRSQALWLALGAGAQVSFPARNQLQLYGAAGALFPLTRATFELSGGTEVHTVPPVTFEADIGLRINF